MKSLRNAIFIAIASAVFIAGCSSSPRNSAQATSIAANAEATLTSFKAADPSLQPLLDKSVGYAVFPSVGRGAWIVGGSYGRGKAFEGGQPIGWADVTQLSVGLQGGAQSVEQLFVFLTQERWDAFKRGTFSFTGNVSAVVLTAGAAATTNPSAGVVAIVRTRGGLMAEAAVGGERLRFSPNAGAPPAAAEVAGHTTPPESAQPASADPAAPVAPADPAAPASPAAPAAPAPKGPEPAAPEQ